MIHSAAVTTLNRRLNSGHGRQMPYTLYVLFYYITDWIGITLFSYTYQLTNWSAVIMLVVLLVWVHASVGMIEYRNQPQKKG